MSQITFPANRENVVRMVALANKAEQFRNGIAVKYMADLWGVQVMEAPPWQAF